MARFGRLPLYGMLGYAAIRVLSLAVAAFLLPRGAFSRLRYSLWHLIVSWDSGRYFIIAGHGYSYIPGNLRHDSIVAWFPGYPLAIDTISWLPGAGPARAGLAVTIAAGLAGAYGLTRLGMTLTGDPRVALLLVALWAVAPGSIVLEMDYPEALFCALAIWALVALTEGRWLTAGLLTALAGTVHNTAIALVAAITVAAVIVIGQDTGPRWRPIAAVLIAPLGLLAYWTYAACLTHHPAGWFWVERNAHNSFDWGDATARTGWNTILHPTLPDVLTVLVVVTAIGITAVILAEKIPVALKVYTAAVVVTAVCTGPDYFGSKPRFLLPAVLLGLPLARLLAPVRWFVLVPLIAVLAAASTWFALYLMSVGWAP
jgi:Gpi18-like mannosyltransferase